MDNNNNGVKPELRYHRVQYLCLMAGILFFLLCPLLSSSSIVSTSESYVLLHSVLELIPIVIGLMIFTLVWSSRRFHTFHDILLGSSLFAVSVLDFVHAYTFPGMPEWITTNTTNKTLIFWLAARIIFALTLVVISHVSNRVVSSQKNSSILLLFFIVLTATCIRTGLIHQDWLPELYTEGVGLTRVKVYTEYLIAILFLYAAYRFYNEINFRSNKRSEALFFACCFMAMSEMFFILYSTITDVYNFFGHVYKLAAFGFIFRGIYISLVVEPYIKAEETHELLRKFLNSIPDMLWVKDINAKYIVCNHIFSQYMGKDEDAIIGKSDFELLDKKQAKLFERHDRLTFEAESLI